MATPLAAQASMIFDGVALAAEEQAAGGVAQDGSAGVLCSRDEPAGGLFFVHAQVGVNGGDDKVEAGEQVVGIVEAAVVEDIAFDAFENAERRQFGIQGVDFSPLGQYPVLLQAVGIESRL